MNNQVLNEVSAYAQKVTIPTYSVGKPNKNPMFLEKRVYQGSSGIVYPYPIIESVADEKIDREYLAIFMENQYIKIMLLPEIGGRVQMALDKTNDFHFVYYNHVIKPALVGLLGPWISGGIEFNWPQHHRPTTFLPVEWRIEDNENGTKTVWMGEIERMFGSKSLAGFTLYPENAYLEISVQLFNGTELPLTFLWWANPAVHVDDNYQSVFPPDVHAVMDHGKRDVSTFPIATGTYYKMDYSPGTDISRFKNIPVPTSFMAYHSDFDFLGSYDHQKKAGLLHVANHHLVPGKKQWTWGCGDFGKAWDRQLTDEDGSYIELMCGAFTDNQPDFTWLKPGEEKRFTQIFMPYKHIGPPKNANKFGAINLEVNENTAFIGAYLSSLQEVKVILKLRQKILFEKEMCLGPSKAFTQYVKLPEIFVSEELSLSLNISEKNILSYSPLSEKTKEIPAPANAAQPPKEIKTVEELYLTGLHLQQYRHATYRPEDYYLEALRREPNDARVNNAYGRLLLGWGQFEKAGFHFRKAIDRLTLKNKNLYNGEPYYNLGLSLKMQGKKSEAYDVFYSAVWNADWKNQARFELARLSCQDRNYDEALSLLDNLLRINGSHHKARHLQAAILRRMGKTEEAIQAIKVGLNLDPLSFGMAFERSLILGNNDHLEIMGTKAYNFIETALDYAQAGFMDEGIEILSQSPSEDPMLLYYTGWLYATSGNKQAARTAFINASEMPQEFCFPNRLEAILALQTAIEYCPNDPRAPYYLGCFWYAHRQYNEAIDVWEKAQELDPTFPTVYRNLSLAYVNKRQDIHNGLKMMRQAFYLDQTDARILLEWDQLLKKAGTPISERLQRLELFPDLIAQRDDLTIEWTALLNISGQNEKALEIISKRKFHPWEGGEGKVTGQYVTSLVEIAKYNLINKSFSDAIESLHKAQTYPENLGEGKLITAKEQHIYFLLGLAYQGLGQEQSAIESFHHATEGNLNLTPPLYYNDQPPDMLFYQALAWKALVNDKTAQNIFDSLITYGKNNLNADVGFDFFAVSLPDFLVFDADMILKNNQHCHYLMALGYLGNGKHTQAKKHFTEVLIKTPDHAGAAHHVNFLPGHLFHPLISIMSDY